jgi:putative membrane-bound dehydrogenase-like protein
MKVADGFEVKLAASEPDIRQPVTMSFDTRGRLWVIQYLQYPTPAGLQPVKVDQYLRTTYDKIPEPPPRGPKGADRITILEDTEGTGHYRKVKDFVTGLNLASGMCLGHGGVYVVQPPYLLFYPDRDGDDVPDGPPEVLLTGFGMEDAHALANSLQWGPDGWLYGAQGSTVTANIRGISFQQGIWRYHPLTKEFELFAEGGGNTWGLDFDRHGNAIAGTNYGDSVLLHQVQGGYYVKGFAKHGELHNPYAFGYFGHVPYKGFKGGHVTCGGIVYQGGSFPAKFNNTYIAANPLANALYWHVLEPEGSSFTAHYAGDFLLGNDTWFRPVDCLTGPDGSLFVADWYDKRINHVDPVDNWDRTNGRIYKVEAQGTQPIRKLALNKLSSLELVDLLNHPNSWYADQARLLLSERRDPAVLPRLRQLLVDHQDGIALQTLWALYVSGGFDEATADHLLDHPNADVRAWTVRLLGDARAVSPALEARLTAMARKEPSCVVRNQLACTAKRLPGKDALPILQELFQHQEDQNDPFIPLLLWWAIENKAAPDREQVLRLLDAPAAWQNSLIRQQIVERLSRRYMAAGTDEDVASCARLLAMAPGKAEADLVLRGMEKALEGRRLRHIPATLERQLELQTSARPADLVLLRLGVRSGSAAAYERALRLVADPNASAPDRASLIEVLGQAANAACVPVLLQLLRDTEPIGVRLASLTALQAYPDPAIADSVLALYPKMPGELRGRAQSLLTGRPATALALLKSVDRGAVNPKEIQFDQLRRMLLHKNEQIDHLVEKHWGKLGKESSGAKRARIASIRHMLGQGRGDAVIGKTIFTQKCAICHTLFGEGNKVGPELTGADRRDLDFLVTSIVDPSLVVRKEFMAHVAITTNGRLLTGLIAEATPRTVTLLDSKNERVTLAREDIEELRPSTESLMPEKLLDDLDDQQTRDLFSYLQGQGPLPSLTKAAGGKTAQAPLKVCLVSGSLEYKSDESLVAFQTHLEANYDVRCTRVFRRADDDLPGLEKLDDCDVMVLFTRRLTIAGEQLERIKKYCQSGKPLVAIRTASHGFQNWLTLDKEVLGGNYQNHYGPGPAVEIQIVPEVKEHPILAGVKAYASHASLYRNSGLADDAVVLLRGSIPGNTEPIAWTRQYKGGRIFYTSLGDQNDFKEESFRRMIVNALFWTTKREPMKKAQGP